MDAELTGRKWVKSAFEVIEVSRFWCKMRVNCVTGGRNHGGPDFYEKVTWIDQPAVTVRTRTGQRRKLNLLTRTVNEAWPCVVKTGSWRRILFVDGETEVGVLVGM
jgi:hypothetical protein